MKQEFKSHIAYYCSLLAIDGASLLLLLLFAPNKNSQLLLISLLGLSYVFFALVHHKLHHSLTVKIMLEYVLIAAIGVSVSLFLFSI